MYIYNTHNHLATEDQASSRQQQTDFPSHLCAAAAAHAAAVAMQLHTHKGTKEHRNTRYIYRPMKEHRKEWKPTKTKPHGMARVSEAVSLPGEN